MCVCVCVCVVGVYVCIRTCIHPHTHTLFGVVANCTRYPHTDTYTSYADTLGVRGCRLFSGGIGSDHKHDRVRVPIARHIKAL